MKIKRPTKFDILKPFIEEAQEVQRRGRATSEWVMKFATTYIGLIIVGVTYIISHSINYSSLDKIITYALVSAFFISTFFAFICWRRLRIVLDVFKVEHPEELYLEATDDDIKNAYQKMANNYENVKKGNEANNRFLSISIYSLLFGILGTISMVFYKLLN